MIAMSTQEDNSIAIAFAIFCGLFLTFLYAWMARQLAKAVESDHIQRKENLTNHRSHCESIDLDSMTIEDLYLLHDEVLDRLKIPVFNDSDAEYHLIDKELYSRIQEAKLRIQRPLQQILACNKCGHSTGQKHFRKPGCRCNRLTDRDLFCDGRMLPNPEEK